MEAFEFLRNRQLLSPDQSLHETAMPNYTWGDLIQLLDDYLKANSSQLEPLVIKWREYKAEQPDYEGRFLIFYEYNNNPKIRNIFIADYLPIEKRFMNVLDDIEILYWAEVQPPSL